MIARRNILMAACLCAVLAAMGAQAAEPSAKSFVESIYAAYKGKDSKGVSLETNAAVRRYFDPKLAALIIKDRKAAHGELPKRHRSLHRCAGLGDRRRQRRHP
jgi:hypothetical protein